jgi:MoxR-like ATPase
MNKYIVSPGLEFALEGAVELQQPLLLTGEPGTGKTTFAKDFALPFLMKKFKSKFHGEVLKFNTKTTSAARDLFYTYDSLSHFQSVNLRDGSRRPVADFIELQALGKAIAMSNPKKEYAEKCRFELPEKPLFSVVLIDEVDKAPRDFTNDILDEIENYRFRIREQDDYMIEKDEKARIVIIMTSNSEKNLPDAFLRRCVFHHIEFPKKDDPLLRDIVKNHLGNVITEKTKAAYDDLFTFFYEAREKAVRKKPATAELVAWLRMLGRNDYFKLEDEAAKKSMLLHNLSFLVKTEDDLRAVRKLI